VKLLRLKAAREHAALTQRELAAKAGVSPTTVVRAEAGEETNPPTARKLASTLDVKPADLMEE